ncbi:MAG TPA: hypothetical protein VE076_07240 [Nitrososphaeraceae archaeon]|nr:hypothetical protein [Nitrososphaeraceae archaeon]
MTFGKKEEIRNIYMVVGKELMGYSSDANSIVIIDRGSALDLKFTLKLAVLSSFVLLVITYGKNLEIIWK